MAEFLSFVPEGVSWVGAIIIIFCAWFSAALTAAFGLGGGLVLLAAMTTVFPVAAVIPVHGVAQFGSNAGRAILQRAYIVWPIFLWFALGGVLGALIGGQVIINMSAWVLKLAIAGFILFTLWGPKFSIPEPGLRIFFTTGVIGTFLTMFFGATGPLVATVLSAKKMDRFATTATHGACMLMQHLLKVLTFGALGFAYGPWILLILAILSAGFLGTWTGTRLLKHIPEQIFRTGFKVVLTIIALYLLLDALRLFFVV